MAESSRGLTSARPPLRRARHFCAAVALLSALGEASPSAAPVLRVKGHADLTLQTVQRRGGQTELTGKLEDASLQRALTDRSVRVVVRDETDQPPEQSSTRTDGDGIFHVRSRRCAARCTVSIRFAGDEYYATAAYGPQVVAPTKTGVQLQLRIPLQLDASDRSQELRVSARAGGRGVAVPITLWLDGRHLATTRTSGSGEALVGVPTSRFGRPGSKTLRAAFAGDDQLNPASRSTRIVLETPVRISLAARDLRAKADGEIDLYGKVRDLQGPVERAAVSLYAFGRHAVSVQADSAGRFSASLPARDFAPGSLDIVARYTPGVIWRRPAESSALVVMIVPPVPPSPRIYIYSLLATLGLVGLFTVVRARLQLSAGLSRSTPERQHPAPATDPSPAATVGGLRRARRHGLRRLDHGISGVVWDPSDECPLAGACLRIEGPGGDFAAETDSAGQFSKDDLPGGDYRVAVSHPGYIAEVFQIGLPHRGQLRAVRIDLVSIRVRILELYKEVALPLLPHPSLWARWTPRELLDHHPDLHELTTVLERAYWSGTLPGHDLLAQAQEWGRTRNYRTSDD